RRAAARRAPVLHRHAGPPRAALAADHAAPAVPRPDRRRPRPAPRERAVRGRGRGRGLSTPMRLRDEPAEVEVIETRTGYAGRVWDVAEDRIRYNGAELVRHYVDHPGA